MGLEDASSVTGYPSAIASGVRQSFVMHFPFEPVRISGIEIGCMTGSGWDARWTSTPMCRAFTCPPRLA
jgi:hypothetical protein